VEVTDTRAQQWLGRRQHGVEKDSAGQMMLPSLAHHCCCRYSDACVWGCSRKMSSFVTQWAHLNTSSVGGRRNEQALRQRAMLAMHAAGDEQGEIVKLMQQELRTMQLQLRKMEQERAAEVAPASEAAALASDERNAAAAATAATAAAEPATTFVSPPTDADPSPTRSGAPAPAPLDAKARAKAAAAKRKAKHQSGQAAPAGENAPLVSAGSAAVEWMLMISWAVRARLRESNLV
jgi:hypothetical protein